MQSQCPDDDARQERDKVHNKQRGQMHEEVSGTDNDPTKPAENASSKLDRID
jgi:hypothetical protein